MNRSTAAFLKKIARTMVRVVAATVLLYAIVVVLAWRFQERIAFPAPSGSLPAPAEFGMPDGEIVSIETADGVTLSGWYLPPDPPPRRQALAPGLIWFHGNIETVGSIAAVLRDFRPPGIGVLAIDYRGYGESEGQPTEAGVYRDADATWAWLSHHEGIDSTRIAVYGRSIGSVIALYLATERTVRAVVLESSFTSGAALAREHAGLVPPALVEVSLNNLERAGRLHVPLLVIHGSDDYLAPIAMGRAIADTGRAEQFLVLEGASHSTMYERGGDRYRDALHAFLNRHLGVTTPDERPQP
jgi:alpha-beta hydrolase superfamily lysophospholipase